MVSQVHDRRDTERCLFICHPLEKMDHRLLFFNGLNMGYTAFREKNTPVVIFETCCKTSSYRQSTVVSRYTTQIFHTTTTTTV